MLLPQREELDPDLTDEGSASPTRSAERRRDPYEHVLVITRMHLLDESTKIEQALELAQTEPPQGNRSERDFASQTLRGVGLDQLSHADGSPVERLGQTSPHHASIPGLYGRARQEFLRAASGDDLVGMSEEDMASAQAQAAAEDSTSPVK